MIIFSRVPNWFFLIGIPSSFCKSSSRLLASCECFKCSTSFFLQPQHLWCRAEIGHLCSLQAASCVPCTENFAPNFIIAFWHFVHSFSPQELCPLRLPLYKYAIKSAAIASASQAQLNSCGWRTAFLSPKSSSIHCAMMLSMLTGLTLDIHMSVVTLTKVTSASLCCCRWLLR